MPSSDEQTETREQPLASTLERQSLCMLASARAGADSEVPARAGDAAHGEGAGERQRWRQPRIALHACLSHQHASNAFLQMEQSASMFHFHTPTACQRTYFSFMRTTKEERQTEDGAAAGRRQTAKGRLEGCALR